jgi:hypothetical protein
MILFATLLLGFVSVINAVTYRVFLNITEINVRGYNCDYSSECDIYLYACVERLEGYSFFQHTCLDPVDFGQLTTDNDTWTGSKTHTFIVDKFDKRRILFLSIRDEDPGPNENIKSFYKQLYITKRRAIIQLSEPIKGYIELTRIS